MTDSSPGDGPLGVQPPVWLSGQDALPRAQATAAAPPGELSAVRIGHQCPGVRQGLGTQSEGKAVEDQGHVLPGHVLLGQELILTDQPGGEGEVGPAGIPRPVPGTGQLGAPATCQSTVSSSAQVTPLSGRKLPASSPEKRPEEAQVRA